MRATWGQWYWPVFLGIAILGFFLIPEIYALITNSANTLSDWVWRTLGVTGKRKIQNWGASEFLVFGLWLTLIIWLTFHFFFRKFT